MNEYSLIGLLLFSFLSSTLVPLSSEAIFLFLVNNKSYSPFLLITIASLGNSLGSILTYWMGFYVNTFFIKKKMNKILKYQTLIEKYGSLMAILSIIPFIGDLLVLAMGFFKTNKFWTHFLIIITKTTKYYLLFKIQQSF